MIKLLLSKISSGYFHRDIWLVTVIGMLNWMGFSMCLPFFSLYLYQERGIPMAVIGFIVLLIGIISALSQFTAACYGQAGQKTP